MYIVWPANSVPLLVAGAVYESVCIVSVVLHVCFAHSIITVF